MIPYNVCTGKNEGTKQERTSSIGGTQQYNVYCDINVCRNVNQMHCQAAY